MNMMDTKVYTSKRSLARLAAVQALYVKEQTNQSTQLIIKDFMNNHTSADHSWGEELPKPDNIPQVAPDWELFEELVTGATTSQAQLDKTIQAYLHSWQLKRLDSVLRALLRVSFFEIQGKKDIHPSISINEYVEIAKGFLSKKEVGFINATLDKFAKNCRGDS